MQCTPELVVRPTSFKALHCGDVSSDSGYSGLFQSPKSSAGADSRRSFTPEELNETPKENLKCFVTPKEKSREVQPSPVTWCETPKLHKRSGALRQRLLLGKSSTVKNDNNATRTEHWLSDSFVSLDIAPVGASNTDLLLSSRKRRLHYTQVRTSTLEDGKVNTGHLSFERSISLVESDFSESRDQLDADPPSCGKISPVLTENNSKSPANDDTSRASSTPSIIKTPKFIRSLYEDSGFGSLTLDKSQDSLVDHNGSFQELLASACRGNGETSNQGETKRRPRLQRQHRLSTLKEGGSQSEDDQANVTHKNHFQLHAHSKEEEVFTDAATPCSVLSAKSLTNLSFSDVSIAKQSYKTPIRSENTTPSTPAINPLTVTPVNLSLTPALELIHVMCQHKTQTSATPSPSLKEELRMTVALTNARHIFRTSMPLAGLIGRKMGVREVDILTELKKRNLWHILALIFAQMNSETIYRCGQVCKSWDEIIQVDKKVNLRRENYLKDIKAALELGDPVHLSDTDTRLALLKRSALRTVQVQSRRSSFSTPQSANSTLTPFQQPSTAQPNSGSKLNKYLEVAKTLFNDECLKPCPRCEHPSRCQLVKREGVCSRADCSFQFCTSCLCAFHGSKDCGSRSAGRRKKDSLLPGSAESKRNVRRL